MIVPTYETTAREQEIIINNQRKEIERLNNDYLEMKDNFRTANDEIERLNNIINELEEYLKGNMNYLTPWEELGVYEEILKKLEELEVNNEDN